MATLNLKITEPYKSFTERGDIELAGDLIIISGSNGGGKSQLLRLIHGQEPSVNRQNNSPDIAPVKRELTIDGQAHTTASISYRSFDDCVSVVSNKTAGHQITDTHINAAFAMYTKCRLNDQDPNARFYKDSSKRLKEGLIDTHGAQSFKDGHITKDDVESYFAKHEFVWVKDVFENTLNSIFLNYASRLENAKSQAWDKREAGGEGKLEFIEQAPWLILNELLELLNIEYRFKDNYVLVGYRLDEQPKLYPIDQDGNLTSGDGFSFDVLSDGEKAIMSLCFATLNVSTNENLKLLLLDEYDAVLNPSLISAFYEILDQYFVKKGKLVVLATHSIATLAMAPTNARFYQVNRANSGTKRVQEVGRDGFSELRLALNSYIEKIKSLEAKVVSLSKVIPETKTPRIITEGKTDWKHLCKALKYFHTKGEFTEIKSDHFFRYGSDEDKSNSVCGTEFETEMGDALLEKRMDEVKNRRTMNPKNDYGAEIAIYDTDGKKIKHYADSNAEVYSLELSEKGISIEQKYTEEEIKTVVDGRRLYIGTEFDKESRRHKTDTTLSIGGRTGSKAGEEKIIDKHVYDTALKNIALTKDDFAIAVFSGVIEISDESWNKFRPEFEQVERIIVDWEQRHGEQSVKE